MNSSLLLKYAFLFVAFLPFSLQAAQPAAAAPTPRQELKLLTVGNSFTDNPTHLLPEFAKAGGKKLTLLKCNLGGHSLDQHVGYLQAYEANPEDPKGSPYFKKVDPDTGEKTGGISLKKALLSKPWDIVTIQQVSRKSYKPETYEPYAGILVSYIKQNAPQAEIVVQETWAYGDDALVGYAKGSEAGLTQQKMYDGLKAAYAKLAKDYGFRLMPVGDAFQTARAQGLVVNLPENIHANLNGEYVGAAIWYEMLFNDNVENVEFVPKDMDPELAKTLRKIAHETIKAPACKP